MSLFRNSRGIAIGDKQVQANNKQVRRDKGRASYYWALGGHWGGLFRAKVDPRTGVGGCGSLCWFQGVVNALLLRQGGIFLLLKAGDKFLCEKYPPLTK